MKTANRGEWSELYVLARLLTEGKLFFADHEGNKNPDAYIMVRSILADTDHGKNHTIVPVQLKRDEEQNTIEVVMEGQVLNTLTPSELDTLSKLLYTDICDDTHSRAFTSDSGEQLLTRLNLSSMKASSLRKDDLRVEATDRFGVTQAMGFSIKSELGQRSTLLNASGSTNFCFKAVGLTDEDAHELNKLSSLKKWLEGIMTRAHVVYDGMKSETFRHNLMFIDTRMDQMLAPALLRYYLGEAHSINDLVNIVENMNPCQLPESGIYRFKFKKFLLYVALGMMPGRPWDGKEDATGGIIVVKEDGGVIGYLLYDRNHFEEYLLRSTKLETPSRSRHHYGSLFKKEDGSWYFHLNLQVRFM